MIIYNKFNPNLFDYLYIYHWYLLFDVQVAVAEVFTQMEGVDWNMEEY